MSAPAVNQPDVKKSQSGWIISFWKDICLFIGTPLIVVPLLLQASTQWRIEDIAYIVLTFGALGHHAPGLMRAYGDSDLFRRYRVRFIVAPIAGLFTCYFFTVQALTGVTLVLILWGIWHFLMQIYGFARIYDAKSGCFDATTRRLDFALCASAFLTAALFSNDQVAKILELAYQSGVPVIPAAVLSGVRWCGLVMTSVVAAGFVVNVFRLCRSGRPYSPAKLLLIAVTCFFLWFALIYLKNVVLGLAMFEVVHDIQYLTIVWTFNNKRTIADSRAGSFMQFLFRRSGALIGLYIGMVVAYGMIRIVADNVSSETLQRVLLSVIATSNLLHFYYDGFIWKVRDSRTRKSLGVDGGDSSSTASIAAWKHGLKWGTLGIVLAVLAFRESSNERSRLDVASAVVTSVPQSARANLVLSEELINHSHLLGPALEHANQAIELGADNFRPHKVIGIARGQLGHLEASIASFEESLERNPDQVWTRFNLGNANLELGRIRDAMEHFRMVLEIDSERTVAHCYLSEGYKRGGEVQAAEKHREAALRLDAEQANEFFIAAQQQFERVLNRSNQTSDSE